MTRSVNYDALAPAYDKRYDANYWAGVERVLQRFIGESDHADVAEVGCGTGHWLARLRESARTISGIDLSMEMLRRARSAAPSAHVVRGRAEHLPWQTGRFARLFCINALHHFQDADAFMIEARRVLRPGGGILIIGLDPHTNLDQWWVYEYFPGALVADRARYLPTSSIRARMTAAGFGDVATEIAQHSPVAIPFATAMERGLLHRGAASQLMVISDAEYREGFERLSAEKPILRGDLRLYATIGYATAVRRGT